MKSFGNWSTLEKTLLGGVVLLLCGAALLVVLVLGGFFVEEELAQQSAAKATPVAEIATLPPIDSPIEEAIDNPVAATQEDQPAAQSQPDTQSITLSATSGAPGTTITVSGEGWPAGSRVVISLVPSDPPVYTVNSAVVDENGRFSVEIIVPTDPRWLSESPVPILVQLDDGSQSVQEMLTIINPSDGPPVTPVTVVDVSPVQPTATLVPPAPSVAQLTVNANALNVRKGPDTTYDVVGVLLFGQQAEIIGRNADATWWQIKFPRAKEGVGWVSAAFVTAENISNVPIVNAPPPPPPPPPTPTPVPNVVFSEWRGEYFNNPDLQGAPVLVRNDPVISFDWGLSSPAPEVPSDNFSARWTRTLNFPAGVYRFFSRSDDGVRLWVDGALLINQWYDQSPTTHAADVYLSDGAHTIRLEYYERFLGAVAMLSWERADQFPDWKAEYFDNPNLQGSPVLARNEAGLNYNWGNGSPAPGIVPNDNFSARWTRTQSFDGADYTFRLRSDDGVRLWVDNDLVLDRWQDGDTGWLEADHNIPGGLHSLRIEYYERTGNASIAFSWWKKDRPDNPPVAVISAPAEGVVGQPVRFDGGRSRRGDNDLSRYEWDFGDGKQAEGRRVNHTYTSADTYRVRLRVIDRKGLRDETSYKIKINQDLVVTSPPIAEISGPANARVNETITFDGSRSQSLSPIERYEWDFGDGTTAQGQKVSHSYAKANLYRVRLTVYAQNGLVSNDNVQVRIDDQITAAGLQANIKAPGVGIVNQDIPFDGSQSTASNQIVSAAWSFGDGQNAQGLQVQHPYAARGTYEVSFTLTDDQGNTSTAKHTITIDDDPNALAPDIAVNPSTQVLQGDPLTFDAGNSKPDNLPDSAFGWQFGDGATATGKQVSHAYAAAGSYTVQLTEIGSNNQTATAQVNLDIQANNPPQAVISGLDQAETGQTVTFDAGQTQSSAAIVRYEWDFGDGTTATGPSVTHAFQPANSYNVTLQVTDQNNLHGTAQKSVQVKDPPVTPSQPPQAVISPPPAPIEAGRLVNFDGSGSQSGDQPIAGYTWDFGDRSPSASGPTVQHTYNQAGTYDVTLTVTDDQGTPNTTSVQVTVNPAPTTQPAVQPPQAVISAPTSETSANVGDTITFDGSGSVVQGQNISYAWDFGDGTQGNGPSVDHAYSGAATYNVTLVVTNESGTNKATVQLTIKAAAQSQPTPAPTPAPQPPQPVIDGPQQGQVDEGLLFDARHSQSASPIVSYEWDFGDGTTDNSGMGVGHSYSVAGKYTIQLTVTDQNGLTGIATWVIQIDPLAVPPLQPTPVPAEPTATPAPVQPADTPTPVPTDTPAAAPTDTPEPAPTDTPPSPPTDTPVPAPTDTPVPAPTDTPPPPPTDTPVPVPTDTPPPPPTDTPPPPPTDTPPPTPTETPPPPPPDNGDGGDGDQGG